MVQTISKIFVKHAGSPKRIMGAKKESVGRAYLLVSIVYLIVYFIIYGYKLLVLF